MEIISTGYSIHFGETALTTLEGFINEHYAGKAIVILVDENTFESCLPLLIKKIPQLADAEVIEIPAGEANKTLKNVAHIWETLTGLGVDRNTLLINLGGGLVSDMGGFAASTFKRGIDYINVPTTLLGIVDASVGGKTGFDFESIKNEIGLFSNPKGVFIDPMLLETLPGRDLLSGYAEMLKHALIADAGLWLALKSINPHNIKTLSVCIPRCIEVKNRLVIADPFDKGERRKLNFGHTIGHAFESNYIDTEDELLHGEAVAIGMVCEAFIAVEKGLIKIAKLKEIETVMVNHFNFPEIDADDDVTILGLTGHDKKNNGDTVNAALINGIGSCLVDVPITPEEIKKALHYCKALSY